MVNDLENYLTGIARVIVTPPPPPAPFQLIGGRGDGDGDSIFCPVSLLFCLSSKNLAKTFLMVGDRAFIFHRRVSFWQDFFFGTEVKVICQCQGQISRSHLRKIAISGALVFLKHILLPHIITCWFV